MAGVGSAGRSRCARLGARLIGADPNEIALVRNTTEGISLVAEGFPWQEGDNVVTLDNEFPSNLYPWINLASRGVETRRVADRRRPGRSRSAARSLRPAHAHRVGQLGRLCQRLADRSEQLAERVHARGALLFLDAIQGLGRFSARRRHAANIDFLAADGHKWLLGPEGAGLLFVRREHLDRLRPLGLGWRSVVNAFDYGRVALNLKPTAARYEGGTIERPWLFGVCRKPGAVARPGCRGNRPADSGNHRSGLCSDWPPSAARWPACGKAITVPASCCSKCRASIRWPWWLGSREGVVLRCRSGKLRISPHAYVDEADIDA